MKNRAGFTLIEMMVSISILSIMIMFLYKSYASLNISNSIYKKELNKIETKVEKRKVIFLDFSLAFSKKIKILNQETDIDVVLMQSSNSLHKRYNPYIAYIVNHNKLYRLESLKEFKEYPLSVESEFSIDYLGEVKKFRFYKNKTKNSYLIDIDFKNNNNILLKIKNLNEV